MSRLVSIKLVLLMASLLLHSSCQRVSPSLSRLVLQNSNSEERSAVVADALKTLMQHRFEDNVHHLVLVFRGLEFKESLLPKDLTRYIIKGRLPKQVMRPTGVFVFQGLLSLEDILENILWTARTRFVVVEPRNRATDRFFIESYKYQNHRKQELIMTEKELKQDFDGLLMEEKSDSTMKILWNDVINTMREFWKFRIQHLAVLVPQKRNVYFYTYFPFAEDHCQDEIVPTLVNVWSDTKKAFYKVPKLFSNKTENLFRCPLNITLNLIPPSVMHTTDRELDGIEGNLIMRILKNLNATPIFRIKHDFPSSSRYSAVDQLFWDVIEGGSDIGAGLLLPRLPVEAEARSSDDVNFCITVCLTWAVPNESVPKPPLLVILDVFSSDLWWLVIYTLLLSATVYGVFLKVSPSSRYRFREEIFKLVSLTFGKSALLPRQTTLRVFLSSFLLFSFLLSTVYQAGFGSNRLVRLPIQQLKTTQQVLASRLEMVGTYAAKQILEQKVGLTDGGDKVQIRPMDIQNALLKVAYEKKTAFLGLRLTSKYVTRILKPELRDLIYLQNECLVQYHPSLIFKPSSPYTRIAEETINRMVEAGFVDHFMKKAMSRIPVGQIRNKKRIRRSPHPTLESGDFLILKWGLFISFLAFIGEHLKYYYQSRAAGRSSVEATFSPWKPLHLRRKPFKRTSDALVYYLDRNGQ